MSRISVALSKHFCFFFHSWLMKPFFCDFFFDAFSCGELVTVCEEKLRRKCVYEKNIKVNFYDEAIPGVETEEK